MFSELKRRRVLRVVAVYAIAAWAIIEVADTILPRLSLPEWTVTLVIVIALLGFPVAVGLAWAFDLTPDGIKRTPEDPVPPALPSSPVFAIIGALLLLGGIAGGYIVLRSASGEPPDESSLSVAVLPFENLSADKEDEYFTHGFHDELLTQLSYIGSLRVISRTSVLGYAGTTKNVKLIADELGVRYILEGTVRRFGERVKITAQLIDSRTDNHVWADTYERPRADLFAIQADVATEIARAMNAELTPEAKARIVALPTKSPEAHDFYLRGLEAARSGGSSGRLSRGEEWHRAVQMFEQAVAADPRFALAYAELGIAHLRLYWFGFDRTANRRDLGKQAVDRAVQLSPDLPQTRIALGYYYYWGMRDYERALRAWTEAQNGLPGSTETQDLRAFVIRRQGRFAESIDLLTRTIRNDPRNSQRAYELGSAYFGARNYGEALRWSERGQTLAPDYPENYALEAELMLAQGDVQHAREAVETGLTRAPREERLLETAFVVEYTARDYKKALGYAQRLPETTEQQWEITVGPLYRGMALAALGRTAEARTSFQRSRELLDGLLMATPADHRVIAPLAFVSASLGDAARARTLTERAQQLLPITADALVGDDFTELAAHTYAVLGDGRRAAELLALILASQVRTPITRAYLQIDPRWDGIRSTPEFQKLVN